tara:strand:+ start:797 stop:1081 length:285 start_codon:yes stop_codon:yes gene_type:complete
MSKKNPDVDDSPQFYIIGFHKEENSNEIRVDYKVTEEFKAWYKNKNNLKRWSRKHFEKKLVELVSDDIRKQIAASRTQVEPPEAKRNREKNEQK